MLRRGGRAHTIGSYSLETDTDRSRRPLHHYTIRPLVFLATLAALLFISLAALAPSTLVIFIVYKRGD